MNDTQPLPSAKNSSSARAAAAGLGLLLAAGIGWSALGAATTAASAKPAPAAATLAAPAAARIAPVAGKRATVLFFLGTSCPISNGYAPEIAAIAKRYVAQGAGVALVYADPGVTPAAAAKHAKEYGLSDLRILTDPDQKLADTLGATVTPEAVVLGPDRAVRYLGRIDNKYVERAASPRPNGATTHDLRAALDAVLAGKTVAEARTRAVGCSIEHASRSAHVAAAGPTYAGQVKGILDRNCVSCHRSGEIGPFPLATYDQAKTRAENIAAVAQAKVMPPWKPEGMHGAFADERRLSDADIKTLSAWAEAGAPEGDRKSAPPTPRFTQGWTLGQPDLVLTMPEAYKIPASGPDIYRCFVLPTGLTADRQMVAIEYRAGNKRVVHHCLGYVDVRGEGRKLDAADSGEGYTSFGGPGFLPAGDAGGWAPGNMPRFLPDGTGKPLWAKSDLILQVHYHPDGKPEEDQTSVGIYFAKKPVTRRVYTLPILARLNIPPGDADYHTMRTVHVPFDADVISVTPHMHLLGRTISLTANLPDGTAEPMIKIGDWDFNWQDTYAYTKPMHLPKGTTITLDATYDNSADNPRNPNNPPKKVGWGEATTDEMCIGFVSFVTDDTNNGLIRLLAGAGNASDQDRARLRGLLAPIRE